MEIFTIDIHTHILPKDIPSFRERFGYGGFIQLDHHLPCRARMMMDNKLGQAPRLPASFAFLK
jgi:aminocarboxymuconate-semialdehyde decarboxylase